ncbi:hypothetical protein YC2023_113444 [Brassica napus]
MVKMNPKTIVTNLLLLLLLQISNFSIVVFSLERLYRKPYKSEFSIRPSTVTRIVVANELWGLKNGNAGFVCAHGPKVWRKSNPGDRYIVIEFEHTGITRYKFVHCHLRSSRGKDGVYYKPEKKLFPWLPFPRSKNGGHAKD